MDPVTALANSLVQYASQNRNHPEEFLDLLASEHRTNQQTVTLLMLNWFARLASMMDFDARNADAIRQAKIMMLALQQAGLSYQDHKGQWKVHLNYV